MCRMHWESFPAEIHAMILEYLKHSLLHDRTWNCLKVALKDTEEDLEDDFLPEVVPRFRGAYHYQNSCVIVHPTDLQEWERSANNDDDTSSISLMINPHGDVGLYIADFGYDAEDEDDPDALLPYSYLMGMDCRFWLSRDCHVEFTAYIVPTHAQFPWGWSLIAMQTHWNEWGDGDDSFPCCPMPVMLQKA